MRLLVLHGQTHEPFVRVQTLGDLRRPNTTQVVELCSQSLDGPRLCRYNLGGGSACETIRSCVERRRLPEHPCILSGTYSGSGHLADAMQR